MSIQYRLLLSLGFCCVLLSSGPFITDVFAQDERTAGSQAQRERDEERYSDTYRQLNLFGDVFERIRAQYVDETVDQDLIENALNGMLTSLDPHSSYLNEDSFEDMQVRTRGEFGGLGIEVTM